MSKSELTVASILRLTFDQRLVEIYSYTEWSFPAVW